MLQGLLRRAVAPRDLAVNRGMSAGDAERGELLRQVAELTTPTIVESFARSDIAVIRRLLAGLRESRERRDRVMDGLRRRGAI